MIFCVEYGVKHSFPFVLSKLGKKVACVILSEEGFPYVSEIKEPECEIGLLLTDDETIRSYNRDYRGKDVTTDVLSFPSMNYSEPSDFTGLKKDAVCDIYNPETGLFFLGDIILNASRVKEQALQYGHSERREAAFLIAHSILHLIGYDHMTHGDARIMEEKQEHYLELLRITRSDG